MVRDNSGIIKNEELVTDWGPAPHHDREHERQHPDVQHRFEQRPTVPELRVCETRAGFTEYQGINNARLALQRRVDGRSQSEFSKSAQWPLAQNHVIGVEHLKSAMQYLEHRLGIFLIVWRGAD